jgi:hypothetical protein
MDATDAGESRLLREILGRVRSCTGLDFSRYREATMRRRLRVFRAAAEEAAPA